MKLRVLLVDDEPAILEMLEAYLIGRGHAVVVAADVASGTARLREGGIDAVIADLKFADGDGLAVIRAAAARGIPVVVASGHSAVEDAVAALRHGAHDLLVKPFRLRTLHDTLLQSVHAEEARRRERAAVRGVELLERAALADTAEAAEALVTLLERILPGLLGAPGAAVDIVPVGHGRPLGAGRAVVVRPAVPAAEPYLRAVDDALRRNGR
jgi:DNA-binding NtrC family response regulator